MFEMCRVGFTVITLLLLIVLATPTGLCTTLEKARMRVAEAYEAVLEAYESGGDVTGLVHRLNGALKLIAEAESSGDLSLVDEANALIESVVKDAPMIRDDGLRARNTMYILYGSVLTVIAVAITLAYFYGPRLFWRIWVKLRADHRVKLGSGGNSKSMILSGEVWAVVMAVILVGAVFAASQFIMAGRVTEAFSELGVLGPRMKIGDYPKTVVAGEGFKLYSYVGNHMGKPMYYVVFIKLGNASTPVDPMPAEPFMRIDLILLHGENRTIPVDIALTEPGVNKRLVFELWIYNSTVRGFTYHGRWCQLWLNVTAPPS
ncbi:MAG: DUF1616 domain-containing protein [Candidatus Bathyarchaeia archaeon]